MSDALPHIEIEDAQRRLEEICDSFDSGASQGYILCRDGTPVAMLLPANKEQ